MLTCTQLQDIFFLFIFRPLLYSLIGQYMNKNRGKSTRSAMQNRGQSSRFLDELENDMGKYSYINILL